MAFSGGANGGDGSDDDAAAIGADGAANGWLLPKAVDESRCVSFAGDEPPTAGEPLASCAGSGGEPLAFWAANGWPAFCAGFGQPPSGDVYWNPRSLPSRTS